MTVSETFAEWSSSLTLDRLDPEVAIAACERLLDGVGCALAAVRLGEGAPALAVARAMGGAPDATIIGTGERVGAQAAALANGALVHALDYDDTHNGALVHVTSAVLPAAFAAGQAAASTGAEVLTACVAGYTFAIRLGAAVRHGFHARGFHATSVVGTFAGALAAARVAGLDPRRTADALGIAGSLASGSLEFLATGSSTKSLHPGLSGMNALTAVRLAAAGADGPASIIEGERGLFPTFTGVAVDPEALTADLDGAADEIRLISIKPYPVCQLSVASLDALRLALGETPLAAVETITFEVPEGVASIVCEPPGYKQNPRTPYEAKFSLPFCAAALALDGRLEAGTFSAEALARPDLLGLAARVRHRVVASDVAPADAPGVVTLTLKDGSEVSARADQPSGGPGSPVTREALLDKFRSNAGGASAAVEALSADLLALASLPSIEPVMDFRV